MLKNSAYGIRNYSVDAVISCVLGGLSVFSMIGAIVASYLYQGNGPAAVGLLGIAGLFLSVTGVSFGIAAWRSQDGGLLMKRVAILLNSIPLIIMVVVYILGWVL